MATIGETLKRLRRNFLQCLEEGDFDPDIVHAFDRAEADTLHEILDGTPAEPAKKPRKPRGPNKPKDNPPAE